MFFVPSRCRNNDHKCACPKGNAFQLGQLLSCDLPISRTPSRVSGRTLTTYALSDYRFLKTFVYGKFYWGKQIGKSPLGYQVLFNKVLKLYMEISHSVEWVQVEQAENVKTVRGIFMEVFIGLDRSLGTFKLICTFLSKIQNRFDVTSTIDRLKHLDVKVIS